MKEVKLGHMVTIENSNPHRLAKHTYQGVWVKQQGIKAPIFLTLTDGGMKDARLRTQKNKEDIPKLQEEVQVKKGFFQSIVDFITLK